MESKTETREYCSPINFQPEKGVFSDPIPFYYNGEYHVFYLHGDIGNVPWEHISSKDLVHWTELPTALKFNPDDPKGPDGMNMFTGSVIEKDGLFHIFYTGWNTNNPAAWEFVMHATSKDLIHWTKHPEDIIKPDGIIYADKPHKRDFRDPFVFWNEDEKQYWMVLLANIKDPNVNYNTQDEETLTKSKKMAVGLLVSKNLKKWKFQQPLAGISGQECPDIFKIGDTYYLLGGSFYSYSKNPRGPYIRPAVNDVIDSPGIYAGKRMFDGKRHIWTGWVWHSPEKKDTDKITWGGAQCLPREIYAGRDGELYSKLVAEIPDVFKHTVFDLNSQADLISSIKNWKFDNGILQSGTGRSECVISLPTENYMLDCRIKMEPNTEFTIVFREQEKTGEGYHLVVRPGKDEIVLGSFDILNKDFDWSRKCKIDSTKPIKIQAFVQGSIIECFINDAIAFTRRAYNFPRGKLGLKTAGGSVQVLELKVRTVK